MSVTPVNQQNICRRHFCLILIFAILIGPFESVDAQEVFATNSAHDDLEELLKTESLVIDTMRNYIETLEDKMGIIKSKQAELKALNDAALKDTSKYAKNPLDGLAIIKRFLSDWAIMVKFAEYSNSTQDVVFNMTSQSNDFKFPTDVEFEEATDALLTLQDIYKLQAEDLSVGQINGVKIGSEMSWNDCLKLGQTSEQQDNYAMAKYWMETAMEKLNNSDATVTPKGYKNTAQFEIYEALLNLEYHSDHLDSAKQIALTMTELQPKNGGVKKALKTIEEKMTKIASKKSANTKEKSTDNKKSEKSEEDVLVENMCRQTSPNILTSSSSSQHVCHLETGNLAELILQPIKREVINLDPYVVIYHNVMSETLSSELKEMIYQKLNTESLIFTKIAQKKLRQFSAKLQRITGYCSDQWDPKRYGSEHVLDGVMEFVKKDENKRISGNFAISLQSSQLGGHIIYPIMEIGLRIPTGSLLYWSNLNEFQEYNYRTKQYICPVIAGTQTVAISSF